MNATHKVHFLEDYTHIGPGYAATFPKGLELDVRLVEDKPTTAILDFLPGEIEVPKYLLTLTALP